MPSVIKNILAAFILFTSSSAMANDYVKAYFSEANKVIQGLSSNDSAKKKVDDLNSSVGDLESLIDVVYYDQTVPESTITTMMNIKNMVRIASELEVKNQKIESASCEQTIAKLRLAGTTAEGYSDVAMSYQEKELIKSISSLCKN